MVTCIDNMNAHMTLKVLCGEERGGERPREKCRPEVTHVNVWCKHLLKKERDCFYYIIMQTYDVGLLSRRHPMEFDAGTRPFT